MSGTHDDRSTLNLGRHVGHDTRSRKKRVKVRSGITYENLSKERKGGEESGDPRGSLFIVVCVIIVYYRFQMYYEYVNCDKGHTIRHN